MVCVVGLVKILVDVEEQRSPVPESLAALGVSVEIARLSVGDYLVARGVAVERKTVSDLHRSVASGRLWSQLHALRREVASPFLVVEGVALDAHGVSPRGIRGALLQVAETGISVVRSVDAQDTALWLQLIARRQRDGEEVVLRRRGRRRMAVSPAGVLATVPGISPTTARRLLHRFGSIADIASASESELREVAGIGAVRAASLSRLLRQDFVPSQLGAFREAEGARLRGPPSRSASPEVPASLARIGRSRGT